MHQEIERYLTNSDACCECDYFGGVQKTLEALQAELVMNSRYESQFHNVILKFELLNIYLGEDMKSINTAYNHISDTVRKKPYMYDTLKVDGSTGNHDANVCNATMEPDVPEGKESVEIENKPSELPVHDTEDSSSMTDTADTANVDFLNEDDVTDKVAVHDDGLSHNEVADLCDTENNKAPNILPAKEAMDPNSDIIDAPALPMSPMDMVDDTLPTIENKELIPKESEACISALDTNQEMNNHKNQQITRKVARHMIKFAKKIETKIR